MITSHLHYSHYSHHSINKNEVKKPHTIRDKLHQMIQLKLTFSVLVFLFLNHFCQGQTLVTKEFDENEYICSYHHFEGVDLYATFDSDNNEIKIYDAFHNVQTSLIYDPDNYYNMLHVYGLSKDVFNSDNNIEFLVFKVSADGNTHKVVLLNEQRV